MALKAQNGRLLVLLKHFSSPLDIVFYAWSNINTGSVNLRHYAEAVGVVTAIINATWASDEESNFAGHYYVSLYSCLTVFELTTQKTLKLRVAGQMRWWHWFTFSQLNQYNLSQVLNIRQITQLETHKIQVHIKCWLRSSCYYPAEKCVNI